MEYLKAGRVYTAEQERAVRDGRAKVLSAAEYTQYLNSGDDYTSHDDREREFGLRERELNLRERELQLRERESQTGANSTAGAVIEVGASGLIGYALGRAIHSVK